MSRDRDGTTESEKIKVPFFGIVHSSEDRSVIFLMCAMSVPISSCPRKGPNMLNLAKHTIHRKRVCKWHEENCLPHLWCCHYFLLKSYGISQVPGGWSSGSCGTWFAPGLFGRSLLPGTQGKNPVSLPLHSHSHGTVQALSGTAVSRTKPKRFFRHVCC